jgi:tetratricopeptide (TPR) repeat protein
MTGRFAAGRRWLAELLAATGQDGSDATRATAISTASNLAFRQGDNEEARRLSEEALTIARQANDPERIVDALVGLARVGLRDENPERVREVSNEGRAIARAAGNRYLERMPLHCLAEATRMAGNYEGARELYEESISLNRAFDDQSMITVEMNNLAAVELHEGRLDRATHLWQESLRRSHHDRDLYLVPYCVMGMGEVAAAARQFERAVWLLGAATGIFESTGQWIDPADRAAYEQSVRVTREELGEETFTATWTQSKGLSVDDAVELALR